MNKRTLNENCNTAACYGSVKDACARYGLGVNSMRNLAEKCNAVVKVGARTLYSYKIIDAFLDAKCSGTGTGET